MEHRRLPLQASMPPRKDSQRFPFGFFCQREKTLASRIGSLDGQTGRSLGFQVGHKKYLNRFWVDPIQSCEDLCECILVTLFRFGIARNTNDDRDLGPRKKIACGKYVSTD